MSFYVFRSFCFCLLNIEKKQCVFWFKSYFYFFNEIVVSLGSHNKNFGVCNWLFLFAFKGIRFILIDGSSVLFARTPNHSCIHRQFNFFATLLVRKIKVFLLKKLLVEKSYFVFTTNISSFYSKFYQNKKKII